MSSDTPSSPGPTVHPGDAQASVDALCALAARLGGGTAELLPTDAPTVAGAAYDLSLVDGEGAPLGTLRLSAEPDDDVRTVAAAIATALELDRAQGRLFDLAEEVAASEQQLADVVGQVAHDLNNPLAAAAMSIEIAREQTDEGLVAQLLDRAAGSAARMKRMTEQLLTLAHVPGPGTADLGAVVDRLTAEFEGLPAGRVELVAPAPVLAMREVDLEVVLVALLDNAVKFAREGAEPRVRISAVESPTGWRVTVADQGIGIDPADAERVFAPTVRLDRRVPGSGAGLTTVRRLVAAAGGRVGVEPGPDGGAAVWFEVPAATSEASA